jgi:TonB family protein
MSDLWKRWEGQLVDGKFPLLRYLGGSEDCAVFLTERYEGEGLVKAAVKVISEAPEDSELQLSRWQQASELSHPHLIPLHEIGRFELDSAPLVYVVMECAEENLAQVLPGRPLTPAEARAMLESVLDALAYIHRKGFVHGHIKPANIMASGDQLKVSSDGLRRAGESPDGFGHQDAYDAPEYASGILPMSQSMSPAGDVWSLGMTLVETLTQSLPVARIAEQQDPLLPRTLPEPFLEIARHCLLRHPQSRWTVAQIAARLEGRAPMSQGRTVLPEAHSPETASQPIASQSRRAAKRLTPAVSIAVGFVLFLAAVLVAPKVLRHHGEPPAVPAVANTQPPVPLTPKQVIQSSQKPPNHPYETSVSKEERSSKAPVPMPALAHPDTTHDEETNMVARLPVGSAIRGEVAHQAMPEVLQSARNSIRGTVRVSVKVDVDRSGNVEDAKLESRGPSKYFARAALEAAQDWRFKPPTVGGQGVLSSWTLQFEFTRAKDSVVPIQELP